HSLPFGCFSFPTSLIELCVINYTHTELVVDFRLPSLHKILLWGPLSVQEISLPLLRDIKIAGGKMNDYFLNPRILSSFQHHHLSVYSFSLTDDQIRYLTDLRSLECHKIQIMNDYTLPFLEHLKILEITPMSGPGL